MIKYIKNLRMVIVLVVCNSSYLLFYEIDDKNKENKILNLKLIGKTTLKKEDNNFSSTHNNCCIINDKYLIIGSKYIDEEDKKKIDKNKDNNKNNKDKKKDNKDNNKEDIKEDNNKKDNKDKRKDDGIYIISLKTFEIIYFYTINNSHFLNSCLFFKNNMFIFCYSYHFILTNKKNKNNYILRMFELKEIDNGKIKIISKSKSSGYYSFIVNSSMILDNYLISSNGKTNSLVKVENDKELIFCKFI